MNILYNIGIYMLSSSFIMVAYVWIRYRIHVMSGYDQINSQSESEDKKDIKKSLAA